MFARAFVSPFVMQSNHYFTPTNDDEGSQHSSTRSHRPKDATYFEKRARNNESAKRSRDTRRLKEEEVQQRLIYLEHENSRLAIENQSIRYQLSQLHFFVPNSLPFPSHQ